MANFTKKAIKESFIRLLKERPLSKITVQVIADDCGINRNSFYYHFQDIPALIEEITLEEVDRLIEMYPEISSIEECLNVIADYAEHNKKLILNIFNSANRDIFEQHLWGICEYAVRTYGKSAFPEKNIDEENAEVLVIYYKCVSFGIVMDWMENGMENDIHETIHRFLKLNGGMVEEALNRSEN
ncbi:MAG: TetR/AcrR family transcriptional regulator C-terminal domain-containing protein [Lachnospiraceae bacterium]|jgi:AcrR family transcriptional regulator|nr:TetR/AcrR family transcriptional regulator C-terminal domain-containing protein [Lachnospiraceae bacterium]